MTERKLEYWEKVKKELEKIHTIEVQSNNKHYINALQSFDSNDNLVEWKKIWDNILECCPKPTFSPDFPAIDLEGFTPEQTVALLNHMFNKYEEGSLTVIFKLKIKEVDNYHFILLWFDVEYPRGCTSMVFTENALHEQISLRCVGIEHRDNEFDENIMIKKIRSGFQEPVSRSEALYLCYQLLFYSEIVSRLQKDAELRNVQINELISKFLKIKESGGKISWMNLGALFLVGAGEHNEEYREKAIAKIKKTYYQNKTGKKFIKIKINNETEEQ